MEAWQISKKDARSLYLACVAWEHHASELGRAPRLQSNRMPNCECDFEFANVENVSEPLSKPAYNAGAFLFLMRTYEDQKLIRRLAHTAYFGALVGVPKESCIWHQPLICPHNLKAVDGDDFVEREMAKRIASGSVRLAAPKESILVSLSPLRIKRRQGSKDRLIHDLSYPIGKKIAQSGEKTAKSINSFASSSKLPLVHFSLDSFLEDVRACGPGSFIWKTDIQDAYRNIRLAKGQAQLFGFVWRDATYVDCSLPFGYTLSPGLFNIRIPEPCEWILRRWQVDVRHYLDDFFGCRSSLSKAQEDYSLTRKLLDLVGVKLHPPDTPGKDVPPATKVEVLGIQIDTVAFTLSLSDAKVDLTLNAIRRACCASLVGVKQLQSLAGLLSAATRVLPLGRPFLLELSAAIDLPESQGAEFGKRSISPQMQLDLDWWLVELPRRNGKLSIHHPPLYPEQIWTDASGQEGIGAHIGREQGDPRAVLVSTYDEEMTACQIYCKEMWALLQALRRWTTPEWAGHKIVCWTDNHGLKDAICAWRTTPKHAGLILRQIASLCLEGDFTLEACWIPTELNTLADSLSRFKTVGSELIADARLLAHTNTLVHAVRADHHKASREAPRT
ncbi:Reverse transcriptase domain [Ceraceosorus bombacis]|uniref:Reverse transcriptase domain n=1 Tax=Ceraceosorus bombacis TaxID=401625 RepID=A0A0P1BQP5_9BASI|nr:Reverse transcriptase domain [Ceraceosorus bombacis]